MPGSFLDDDLESADNWFDPDVFGTTVTYRLASGGSSEINAIFDAAAVAVELGDGVPIQSVSPQLTVAVAELPHGHSDDGDEVVVDSVFYVVRNIEVEGDGKVARLFLEKR